MPFTPSRVRWTDHASDKAALLRIARTDLKRTVLERHHARRRNARSADWLLTNGRIAIAYDHPDHDDATAARVVTHWRRR